MTTHQQIRPPQHHSLLFWSLFALLNMLLFLPIYLFFRADAAFWPLAAATDASLPTQARLLLVQRPNPDIFRLNLEWSLLVGLWLLVRPLRRRFVRLGILLLYLAQLGYATYEGFIRAYYLLEPNLYNDMALFTNGTRFTLDSLKLPLPTYAAAAALLVGGVALLAWLHRLLLPITDTVLIGNRSKAAMAALLLATALSLGLVDGAKGGVETAVSSFTAKMAQNVTLSREAQKTASQFSADTLLPFYQFTGSDLAQKPNIYIIFIESYGSVLFKRGDFYASYRTTLNRIEKELIANNWHIASTRSEAPTWGGGSWLSYTSALSGLRLSSQNDYLTLLDQYQTNAFPHLFNYLRQQGYTSYRLSGMASDIAEADWQRYLNFYGIDQWIRFSDLPYNGPLFGWGPALPDQYAINYAHAQIQAQPNTPAVFFYITQNSHYPWTPLPEIVPDWRTLADAPAAPEMEASSHQEMRRHYLQSIQYELTMLTDFITKEGGDNDLFILIGDHQPARVARYADGWDTPLHIISRNPDLINAFTDLGFVPQLNTRDVEPSMRHEGFYSLFTYVLCSNTAQTPPICPKSGCLACRCCRHSHKQAQRSRLYRAKRPFILKISQETG